MSDATVVVGPRVDNTNRGVEVATPDLQFQLAELDRRVASLVEAETQSRRVAHTTRPERIWIWGVPFSRLTLESTLHLVQQQITEGEPGFFITANLNYVMLTAERPELRVLNERASFIVADGMPIIWRSRLSRRPLPERVAGSELVYAISHLASRRAYRLFLLGGAPGVADRAAEQLKVRYPNLQIAGTECPPFRAWDADEEADMIDRIRRAKPDLLFVALGQPKGELWLAKNCERLGVPVCVQLGASFDFAAGHVHRAPRWLQRLGLEWLHRMLQEPRRLAPRYWRNFCFLSRSVIADIVRRNRGECNE